MFDSFDSLAKQWEERLACIMHYFADHPLFAKDVVPYLTECMVLTVKLDRYYAIDHHRSYYVSSLINKGYGYSRILTKKEFSRCYQYLDTSELPWKIMVPYRTVNTEYGKPTEVDFRSSKKSLVATLEKLIESRCVWACENKCGTSHNQKMWKAMEIAENFLLNEGFVLTLVARDWFKWQHLLVRWSNVEFHAHKQEPYKYPETRVLVQSASWCNEMWNRINSIENCLIIQDRFSTQC